LRKNNGFVAGFYTTVDSYALYYLRSSIDDETWAELPPDWPNQLVDQKRKLLENIEQGPGVANLISGLFHVTLDMTMNWLGSQNLSFQFVYDPREKREDAFLLKFVSKWLSDEEAAFKRFPGIFLGGSAAVTSSTSPGLMLTDLIVRDIRNMFLDLPGLTAEQSSSKLILSTLQDEPILVRSIRGIPFKTAHVRPMSPSLRQSLRRPTANSTAAVYLERLAKGKISCHARFGELRSIDFANSQFEDMVD
jgi:hypothetical protein